MQPIQPFDPSTATYGTVPGVMLPNGGSIVLINKSPYELWVTFESRDTMDVPAWTARLYQTCERVTSVTWQYAQGWTPSGQSGAPSSLVSLELYGPQEKVPENYPVALTRLVSVGNQISTTGSTSMKNDGQAPGTSVIEATPSDQSASAIQEYNDGSGYRKVLSAGAQRTILNVARGNATTGKAVIDLGDAGDLTITTYHGQFDAGVSFPVTQIGAGTLPAGVSVPTSRLAAGALPAGVTLPPSQLTAGTAPAGVDLTSVYSDGGNITSDGAGTLTVNPTTPGNATGVKVGPHGALFSTDQGGSLELGAGQNVNPGVVQTPYIDFHTTASARDFDARIIAEQGSNAADGQAYLVFHGALFGFTQGATPGSRIAQIGNIPGHGAGDMAIAGSTYWTTQASAGYNNSASFTGFDVAEVYATDREYPDGTLVCPGEDGRMTRCTHDGCHAALVVSKAPALGIGDPLAIMRETGETCELLALVGRMRVQASGPVAARQLVTSDGAGGVRAMRPGEAGYALGYALAAGPGEDGTVGILIRPQFCIAPAE